MKRQMLFIMNNLTCGGAEKALISLLNVIDYSRYEVDLYLFKHEGLFMSKIPKQVNLLPEPAEFKYFDMPFYQALQTLIKRRRWRMAYARLSAGLIFKTEQNAAVCEQKVWRYLSSALAPLNKTYDVAVGYLEKNPIYFCVEKVRAKKKVGFVHTDYDKLGMNSSYDVKHFEQLDKLFTVSEECASVLMDRFPMFSNKIEVMYNVVSPDVIKSLATEADDIDLLKMIHDQGTKIVSIGRLHQAKGFDLAVEACNILIKKGLRIKWYLIGEGEERNKLEALIKAYHLEQTFILVGQKENPYPLLKSADIYVQPSRFEGKSIALEEAKIMNKPIVVTNYRTVSNQIVHRVNGLVAQMNAESIASAIKLMIDHPTLQHNLVHHLAQNTYGTESEIDKLLRLIKVG